MMKIDKNIPVPTVRQEYQHYPFAQMEVGDSFFVLDHDGTMAHRLQVQVSYQRRKTNDDKQYTTRRVADGVRVWRVR